MLTPTMSGYGDFDGYLATFSAAKRRKVRAERRRVQESGLLLEVRHGDQIDAACGSKWSRRKASP